MKTHKIGINQLYTHRKRSNNLREKDEETKTTVNQNVKIRKSVKARIYRCLVLAYRLKREVKRIPFSLLLQLYSSRFQWLLPYLEKRMGEEEEEDNLAIHAQCAPRKMNPIK